jgi:hypothetical protein
MSKNSKEQALKINNDLLFRHEQIDMVNWAQAWKNVSMDTKEYYISQYNVGIPTPR